MSAGFCGRIAVMAVSLATLSPELASANCATRHFYNNAPKPFILAMGDGTGSCSYGKSGMEKVCVIPPGDVGEIHYANSTISHVMTALSGNPLPPPGNIIIKSDDQGKIYNGTFSVNTDACYISHHGSTGRIAVNDPANGDINTCGKGKWSCN